jgi:hypothetical protein
MSVDDYAAMVEELSLFCPHYNDVGVEASKCIKFESGLHPETKKFIRFHEVRVFLTLVNKCKIYDEDNKARSSYYQNASDEKGKSHERGKQYGSPGDKGKKEGYWWV